MELPNKPIPREKSLSERTVDRLRELVVNGYLRPGDRLNEVEIATSLGVSRGPVREAVQRLASDGLLVLVSHRGAFVPKLTPVELAELYEVRAALECMAVRLAAERGSSGAVDELREMLDSTRRIFEAGDEVPYPTDIDFHRKVIEISGNAMLLDHASRVHLQLTLARSRSGYDPVRARAAYEEHIQITDLIAAGDPEASDRAMRAHLKRSLTNVLPLLDSADR